MKDSIIATGLSGMVGDRIARVLADSYGFQDLSLETGVDITDPGVLEEAFKQTDARICLHLAAITDVDACERAESQGENSVVWKVNVEATENVARLAAEHGIYLVYISTEFVFDGKKPVGELYTETDTPEPINWYGMTKYLGEQRVVESGAQALTVRIASPYRTPFESKRDFVRALRARLEENKPVKAVADGRFSPTLVTDIAEGLRLLFENQPTGILHLVGSNQLSPYEASVLIAELYGLPIELVSETTNEAYFTGRARRGLNLALSNQKVLEMGVQMRSFAQGLEFIRFGEDVGES